MLDSAKARHSLSWRPVWDVETTIQRTIEWYRAFYERDTLLTQEQIDAYGEEARTLGVPWATA
jgi:CDP-glucose 4,6-dehydratase